MNQTADILPFPRDRQIEKELADYAMRRIEFDTVAMEGGLSDSEFVAQDSLFRLEGMRILRRTNPAQS